MIIQALEDILHKVTILQTAEPVFVLELSYCILWS